MGEGEPLHEWEPPQFSPRERAVLGMLAQGMQDKEIAGVLEVGLATVRDYRKNLHRGLGSTNVVQLLLFAGAVEKGKDWG
jgi:DNA-binding NarL/FixJ family response regulator